MASSCLTHGEGHKYVLASSLFAVLGSLANVVTIFLIWWTRAYRQHVHRLTFYLAILGLLFSTILGLDVVPADVGNGSDSSHVTLRKGERWTAACAWIGFAVQHLAFSRSLATLSICLYIFMLAVFEVKLNRFSHEVTGVIFVLFLPALLSWIPFLHNSYGLTGAWCWIKEECDNGTANSTSSGTKLQIVMAVLDIVPNVASLALVVTVVVVFLRRALHMPDYLQKQHRRALKEVLPLGCYPFCLAVTILCLSFTRILAVGYSGLMVVVALLQTVPVVLPLSFMLHSSVRRSCIVRLTPRSAVAGAVQGTGDQRGDGVAASTRSRRNPTETDSLLRQTQ